MHKFSIPLAILSEIFHLNWLTFLEAVKKIKWFLFFSS